MPPPKHRKKPFSAKQRKEQLKAKRDKKRFEREADGDDPHYGRRRGHGHPHVDDEERDEEAEVHSDDDQAVLVGKSKMNQQPIGKTGKGYDPNRYRLHFQKDTNEDIEKRKAQAREPFEILPEENLEIDLDYIYKPGSVLDMPKRPSWDYSMKKEKLLAHEERYFRGYLENIMERYSGDDLSYFELNLETWRQLWRVLEMSDVVLLITDIRHPALHFSPALYDYVTKELKKHLILVLNKIDLAPPPLVVAWKHYFMERFPDLHVVCFTSFPKDRAEMELLNEDPGKVLHRRRRRGKFTAVGAKQLLKACESIVHGSVDLSSWREKIEDDLCGEEEPEVAPEVKVEEGDMTYQKHVEFRDGVLTIGCCGYPNVGKSSLMNGLMGKKVVSVSRTPGHTKHFQTIFLTPTVKMCDSPGLVFPSLVSRPMQILAGIYPIAQVREPYSAVGYLAQRIPVHRLLKLKHPDAEGLKATPDHSSWSALDICDAYAEKRGFLTAKAARNDMYRAANHILRQAMEGRLCMCMRPPHYTQRKASWEKHLDTEEIASQQEMHRKAIHFSSEEEEEESDEDEEADAADMEEEAEFGKGQGSNANGHSKTLVSANPFALLGDE